MSGNGQKKVLSKDIPAQKIVRNNNNDEDNDDDDDDLSALRSKLNSVVFGCPRCKSWEGVNSSTGRSDNRIVRCEHHPKLSSKFFPTPPSSPQPRDLLKLQFKKKQALGIEIPKTSSSSSEIRSSDDITEPPRIEKNIDYQKKRKQNNSKSPVTKKVHIISEILSSHLVHYSEIDDISEVLSACSTASFCSSDEEGGGTSSVKIIAINHEDDNAITTTTTTSSVIAKTTLDRKSSSTTSSRKRKSLGTKSNPPTTNTRQSRRRCQNNTVAPAV